MSESLPEMVCRYHYDPLDRQVYCVPFPQAAIQRFHRKTRLTTEIQDRVKRSILQHNDQLLAQHQSEHLDVETVLLVTDQQRSVLHAVDAARPFSLRYTPYGHRPAEQVLPDVFGFNGERPDPVTGHYHLGNGYRQFNPVLMRFNNPDSWSPLNKGGLNAYAYCAGDPVNRSDPTGHFGQRMALVTALAGGIGAIGVVVSFLVDEVPDEVRYGFMALTAIGVMGNLSGGLSAARSSNMTRRMSGSAHAEGIEMRPRSNAELIAADPLFEGHRNRYNLPPPYQKWERSAAVMPPPLYSKTRRGSLTPPSPSYNPTTFELRRDSVPSFVEGSLAASTIRNGGR